MVCFCFRVRARDPAARRGGDEKESLPIPFVRVQCVRCSSTSEQVNKGTAAETTTTSSTSPMLRRFAYLPGAGPKAQQDNLEKLGWAPPDGSLFEQLDLTCPAPGCGAVLGTFVAAKAAPAAAGSKATYESRLNPTQKSTNSHFNERQWQPHVAMHSDPNHAQVSARESECAMLCDCDHPTSMRF